MSAARHRLIEFLEHEIRMTHVYQPVIIMELLRHGGQCSKADLARRLAQYDDSVQEYYEKIIMRWPKITLLKHGIVEYHRKTKEFQLREFPSEEDERNTAICLCKERIAEWVEKKKEQDGPSQIGSSIRYEVLKAAGGKCQLCGIPSSLQPIDIDHVIPRALANKNGKVNKGGDLIDVDSRENLQALCVSCNRAKRDADASDFRSVSKLVRDRIPEIIISEGREPALYRVSGSRLTQALFEKLVEEHRELIAEKGDPQRRLEELADMLEVILALALRQGVSESEFMDIVRRKRQEKGAFQEGYILSG